jgi:hypothetical protein
MKLEMNYKKMIRQLEVIKLGIEYIIDGLRKIEDGCPDCGSDKVVCGEHRIIDEKTRAVKCSECGCEYEHHIKD